jgi:Uma2 family endonuclease
MAGNAYLAEADDGRIGHMGGRQEALVDELYRVDGKAEIVNGRVVRMSPAGGLHGYAAGLVLASLLDYARKTRRGFALPDNVAFLVRLPHRRSFSPDAAFWTGDPLTRKFPEGAPIFAVEVRSPEDYGARAEKRMAGKRTDYFAAGTQAVWDVDLEGGTVRLHLAADPTRPLMFGRSETANAEPVLPGWSMPVDDLFPPH